MTAAPAVGYRLTLPGGWLRLTPGETAEADAERYADKMLAHYSGRDRVLRERELVPIVRDMIARAEAAGAIDLYVFDRELAGAPVTMSFQVSVIYLGPDFETDEALEALVGAHGVEIQWTDLAGVRMLRSQERTTTPVREARDAAAAQLGVPADTALDLEGSVAAHQIGELAREALKANATRTDDTITYTVGIPDAPGAFLLLSMSVPVSPISEAQIVHFDAVASTLAWR